MGFRLKAFDTIEWNFSLQNIKKFNFGPDIQTWVKEFYNNVSSCVLNNGHASEFLSFERGVRQGCPLSGLLFIIGIKILKQRFPKFTFKITLQITHTTMYKHETSIQLIIYSQYKPLNILAVCCFPCLFTQPMNKTTSIKIKMHFDLVSL